MAAAGIPGLSLALVRDAEPSSTVALGVASVETGEPVQEGTVFEAASLSKPVFTYAVLRLVDRGVLDLDEPLWSLLRYPRLKHDERARSIMPRMVLTHTSGLPNWGDTPSPLSAV
jgi:CubicO group peptidase (beta-lactamase class C family)